MTRTWKKGSNKQIITNLLIAHKGLTCHQLGADHGIRRPQATLQAMEVKDGVWFDKGSNRHGEVVWRLHGDRVQLLPDNLRDLKVFGLKIRCSTQPGDTSIMDGMQVIYQQDGEQWFNDLSAAKRDALSRDLLDVVRKHLGSRLPETGVVARAVECGDVHVDPAVDALDIDLDLGDILDW